MFYLKKCSYSLRKDKYLSFLDLALAPVPCSLWVFPGLGAFGHVLGVSFPVVIWSSAQCKYWARTQTLHRSNTSQQENTIWSICFATEAEGIDDGGKRLKRLAAVRLHSKLTQHYQVILKTPPQQVAVVNLLYDEGFNSHKRPCFAVVNTSPTIKCNLRYENCIYKMYKSECLCLVSVLFPF